MKTGGKIVPDASTRKDEGAVVSSATTSGEFSCEQEALLDKIYVLLEAAQLSMSEEEFNALCAKTREIAGPSPCTKKSADNSAMQNLKE